MDIVGEVMDGLECQFSGKLITDSIGYFHNKIVAKGNTHNVAINYFPARVNY